MSATAAMTQEPPGLEAMKFDSIDLAQEIKAQLIKEVSDSCKEHVDRSVEALYKKGQKAMTYMIQQQAERSEKIQGEIHKCAESYRALERENRILRASLEALMKTLLLSPCTQDETSPADFEETTEGSHRDLDSYAEPEVSAGSGETGSPGSEIHEPQEPSSEAPSQFSLTLRRADTVAVGLHVQGGEEEGLMVERVLPGGAVEAWNRMCPGEQREIRPGDRIISINGHEDAEAMRNECLSKFLLRMTIQRSNSNGLRASADEFIPQVP